jgi:hypothetical protein
MIDSVNLFLNEAKSFTFRFNESYATQLRSSVLNYRILMEVLELMRSQRPEVAYGTTNIHPE